MAEVSEPLGRTEPVAVAGGIAGALSFLVKSAVALLALFNADLTPTQTAQIIITADAAIMAVTTVVTVIWQRNRVSSPATVAKLEQRIENLGGEVAPK